MISSRRGSGQQVIDSVLGIAATVYVRERYLGNWCPGFAVAEVLPDGYRIRRLADDRVVPHVFPFDDVNLERRHNPLRESEGSFLHRRQFQ